MKILITKAGGFVGRHLLKSGYAVRSCIRSAKYTSALEKPWVDSTKEDLAYSVSVERAINGYNLFYHSAARTSRHNYSRKEVITLNGGRTSHVSVRERLVPPHQTFPF
jgi:nucleoside-diphosphate-sugar epimerase